MAITDGEKELLEAILTEQTLLIESELDGERVILIALLSGESEDSVVVSPVAVMLTDEILSRIPLPEGVTEFVPEEEPEPGS